METNIPGFSNKDFNTVTPSAKMILMMRGMTDIPFARQTVELISLPNKFDPDYNNKDFMFWGRMLHMEYRYWSVDILLTLTEIKNVLELSSGYSFRCLDKTKEKGFYYIDTDLPDMISTKKGILSELKKDCTQNEGTLIMEPLNALDEKRFREIVAQFPAGELVIVNEGLLMYFNQAEREFVCRLIHDILKERGGYWITADAYLKGSHDNLGFRMDPEREAFYQEHDLHENRFDSFEEAENFFKKMGFKIEMEANVDYGKMQSLNKFMQYSTPEDRERMKDAGRLQATWCLKPI